MADNKWLGSSVLTAGQPTSSLGKPTSTLALPSGARSRGLALRQAGVDSKTQKHPGYSLFEWNRMCENERDLAGVGGRLLYVTEDELSKHNTEHDIWTAIRGRVYNVTAFMKYHPGGKAQLMKGAGIDCTALFDKIHTWVNDEVILRRCVVGLLAPSNTGGKMAEEPLVSEQHTSAVKPDNIRLIPATSGGSKGIPEPSNRYRPMRVPVNITLEPPTTSAAMAPPTGVGVGATSAAMATPTGVGMGTGGRGEPGVLMEGRYPHGGVSDARRRPMVVVDPAPVDVQPAVHGVTPAAVPPAIPVDIEQRVKTLEQQVQRLEQQVKRLTETVVHREGTDSSRRGQGSGLWYVLTFAGLMTVPLVVAFMFRYKKAL